MIVLHLNKPASFSTLRKLRNILKFHSERIRQSRLRKAQIARGSLDEVKGYIWTQDEGTLTSTDGYHWELLKEGDDITLAAPIEYPAERMRAGNVYCISHQRITTRKMQASADAWSANQTGSFNIEQ